MSFEDRVGGAFLRGLRKAVADGIAEGIEHVAGELKNAGAEVRRAAACDCTPGEATFTGRDGKVETVLVHAPSCPAGRR